VVDTSWTPAVTLGVRLVRVLADCLQHAGQGGAGRRAPLAGLTDRASPGERLA